jgi:peptidoglycan/LPS O-acetylase OafA/YrhL
MAQEQADQASAARPFVLGHRPALDGMRGLAILSVLLAHVWFHPTKPQLFHGGFIGVDVFFVLSGFLITALLLQEHQRTGRIRLGRFYLRRALRLLPALLGLLVICWLSPPGWGLKDDLARLRADTRSVLLYYHNWRAGLARDVSLPFLHFWSLAVEEQFYLVWPVALASLLACGARRRWLAGLTLLGVVVPAVLRNCLPSGAIPAKARLYYCTDTRLDALSLGCLLALVASWGLGPSSERGRRLLRVAAWVAAVVLLGHGLRATMFGAYMFRAGFTLVALSAVVLLAALLWEAPPLLRRLLEVRPLGWLGRISYGTYLWNMPLIFVVLRVAQRCPDWLQITLLVAAPIAAGAVSFFCLERPFLRLKSHLGADKDSRPRPASVDQPRPALPECVGVGG